MQQPTTASAASTNPEITPAVAMALLESFPDALVITDRAGTITLVNQLAQQLFGYHRDELVGQPVEMLLPIADRPAHVVHRRRYSAKPTARQMGQQLDLRGRRADGSEFPAEVSLSPSAAGDGHIIAAVRDVTARLERHTEQHANHELQALVADRERIARDLHDTAIQNLFGVGLALQGLATRTPPDLQDRLADIIDRQDAVIREIRTAIFGLTTRRTVHGSVIDQVRALVEESARILQHRPALRTSGAIDSATDHRVAEQLIPTLREALSNVAHHAQATQVDVDLDLADGQLRLRVADNGIGLPHPNGGHAVGGLRNLADRAEALGGTLTLEPNTPEDAARPGTTLTWTVPC